MIFFFSIKGRKTVCNNAGVQGLTFTVESFIVFIVNQFSIFFFTERSAFYWTEIIRSYTYRLFHGHITGYRVNAITQDEVIETVSMLKFNFRPESLSLLPNGNLILNGNQKTERLNYCYCHLQIYSLPWHFFVTVLIYRLNRRCRLFDNNNNNMMLNLCFYNIE